MGNIPRETLVFNKETRIPTQRPQVDAECELRAIYRLAAKKLREAENTLLRGLPFARELETGGFETFPGVSTQSQFIRTLCDTSVAAMQESLADAIINLQTQPFVCVGREQ